MSDINNMGPKRFVGNHHGKGFKKGQSGNPAGSCSLANDLKAAGLIDPTLPTTPAEVRAKWWATILPIAFAGPQADNDPNWRYAHQQVGDRLMGKPKEHVELSEGPAVERPNFEALSLDEKKTFLALLRKAQEIGDDEPGVH